MCSKQPLQVCGVSVCLRVHFKCGRSSRTRHVAPTQALTLIKQVKQTLSRKSFCSRIFMYLSNMEARRCCFSQSGLFPFLFHPKSHFCRLLVSVSTLASRALALPAGRSDDLLRAGSELDHGACERFPQRRLPAGCHLVAALSSESCSLENWTRKMHQRDVETGPGR